jgi:phosphotransferase system HPr (HPr) family protein
MTKQSASLPEMIELTATVRNAHGIHCRPSAAIVKAVTGYPGDIEVIAESGTCDPRSIMGLIALGLAEGAAITIRVSGPEEEAQCRRLVELFELHYDFPPRHSGEDTKVLLQEMGASVPPPAPPRN